jgi:hypothetical protein
MLLIILISWIQLNPKPWVPYIFSISTYLHSISSLGFFHAKNFFPFHREGSSSSRWNPSPVPSGPPSRPPSAASNRSSAGRAGTTTSAGGRAGITNEPSTGRAGTTDGGELSEFGDMGAAARSYGGGGGKGEGGRPPAVPLETVPRLHDRNPYRIRHGLVVYDRSAANSGEWRHLNRLPVLGVCFWASRIRIRNLKAQIRIRLWQKITLISTAL